MLEDFAPFGSQRFYLFAGLLALARGMDFISTWVATPNLLLEANPLARKMGWKVGIAVNVLLCVLFALWPLPAVVIITTSVLVAARNFQSAWLMRSMGEINYRLWMSERLLQAPRTLFLLCLIVQAVLYTSLGGALMYFSHRHLVPFGVGMGMITYSCAVLVYTLLSVWRMASRSV
jgi:hypothetical protein